jgi:hypothetical protein
LQRCSENQLQRVRRRAAGRNADCQLGFNCAPHNQNVARSTFERTLVLRPATESQPSVVECKLQVRV